MSERRVRSSGRQQYGRAEPLRRPGRARVRRPRLNLWQRRLVLLALLVVAILFGLSRLFAITSVVVVAPSREAVIQAESLKLLHESVWQGNLLTLNDQELVSDLQQADPVLRSVTVARQWFHGARVTATLKQPSLGWSTGNQQYLLDRDGTAIGPLPAGANFPVVTDGSNLPVQVGQRVAPAQFVAFASTVVPALAADGIHVTGLSITDTTLDLTASTNKGYKLIFDTSRPVGDELSDLKAVLALLATQHKAPAQYIDLRIVGKAYYQ